MDGDELVFLYQLKDGICQLSYAANIATLAGLPDCLVQRGVEVKTNTRHTERCSHRLTLHVCLGRCLNFIGQESLSNALIKRHQMSRQTGLFNSRFYRMSVKAKTVHYMSLSVTDRCRSVVEKFLSLDLDDKDLDLQLFMKQELLPSADELLNRS